MTQTQTPRGGVCLQLRIIASFALLGSVMAGITMGWYDFVNADTYRAIGVFMGAGGAIVTGAYRVL